MVVGVCAFTGSLRGLELVPSNDVIPFPAPALIRVLRDGYRKLLGAGSDGTRHRNQCRKQTREIRS